MWWGEQEEEGEGEGEEEVLWSSLSSFFFFFRPSLEVCEKMSLSPDYLYDEVSMGQNLRTVGQLYATLLFSFSSFPKIPLFLFSSFSFSFSFF